MLSDVFTVNFYIVFDIPFIRTSDYFNYELDPNPDYFIEESSGKQFLKDLKEFLNDYEIGGFVIGLPLSLDNSENDQTKKVREFSKELKLFFSNPYDFWDERYSSDIIFKEMRKSELSSTKIKKLFALIALYFYI